MKENLNLKKQLAKLQKENEFLKKLRHPPSGIRLEAYRFIQNYNKVFGLRWLLRKSNIYPTLIIVA